MMLLCAVMRGASAAVSPPPDLAEALASFRSDPPPGWSFTQTTTGEGKSVVERYDATRPSFDRWTLLEKDGRAPTADELRDYGEARSRRSRTGTAPKIVDQFILEGLEVITDTAEYGTYRYPLRPGENRDSTARSLRATVVVHKPTHTIQSIELGNIEPFRPTLGVKIVELKTLMSYSLTSPDTPSLPQKVVTHVRGTAFLFKTLDADMTVVFSGYELLAKKPATP